MYTKHSNSTIQIFHKHVDYVVRDDVNFQLAGALRGSDLLWYDLVPAQPGEVPLPTVRALVGVGRWFAGFAVALAVCAAWFLEFYFLICFESF